MNVLSNIEKWNYDVFDASAGVMYEKEIANIWNCDLYNPLFGYVNKNGKILIRCTIETTNHTDLSSFELESHGEDQGEQLLCNNEYNNKDELIITKFKNIINACYKQKRYNKTIEIVTRAINYNSISLADSELYYIRSLSYEQYDPLELTNHLDLSLTDGLKCIQIQSTNLIYHLHVIKLFLLANVPDMAYQSCMLAERSSFIDGSSYCVKRLKRVSLDMLEQRMFNLSTVALRPDADDESEVEIGNRLYLRILQWRHEPANDDNDFIGEEQGRGYWAELGRLYGDQLAGKLTGMLLELPQEEVCAMLWCGTALRRRLLEAQAVLAQHHQLSVLQ